MTVSYTPSVGTATKFGAFGKVILIWQGSLYKLTFPGLFLYLAVYIAISFMYRFLLNTEQRTTFENVCMFCDSHSGFIPLNFVLAFYVSLVVSRWWDQWNHLAWPDNVAFKINMYCRGIDEHARLIRRTVVRYACLAITMSFRYVSSKVFKRFPTMEHLSDCGLVTDKELLNIQKVNERSEFLKYVQWIPLSWASSLVVKAYEQGYIKEEGFVRDIENEILAIKVHLGTTLGYDWINLPVLYTQVVTLAVYSYFGFALLGRQWLDPEKDIPGYHLKVDYYFPIFTVLQYLFYVGWLKVAEALMNPYGEDDDDFDLNFIIDRHLQVAFMMIDEVGQFPPQPVRDVHWDIGIPSELPYTVASLPFRGTVPETASFGITVPIAEQQIVEETDLDKTQNIIQDIYGQVTNFFTNAEPTPVSGRRSFFIPKTQPTRNGSLDNHRERTVSESSSKSRRGSRMFNNPFNRNRVSSIDEEDPYENITVNDGSVLPSITLSPVNEEGTKNGEKNQYLTEYL